MTLPLEGEQQARITSELLVSALGAIVSGQLAEDASLRLAGHALVERDLRVALEALYRRLARTARSGDERIRLVDRANGVRPRTWT